MIEFGRPLWLWGLVALPLLAAILALGARRRAVAVERLVGTRLASALAPGASWRRNVAKTVLRCTAVGMLLVALAAPRFGSQLVKVEREGIDLVIALDVSLSMLAEDVAPNRLERAKREITDLIRGLQGDRVGIVVFAGEAVALCPLTVDYDAALMLARSVDVFSVSEPGSAIADAIEVATAMFDGSQGGDRAIILVTDGENQHGDPEAAARAAAEKGIRVYAIGLGSPKGELIPERATDGSVVGYKKDARGETVLSRLDEGTLRKLAAASGGQYLPATSGGLEIQALYDAIAGMQRKLIKGEFVERRKERFIIPLAAALVCLLLDALLTTRATGKRPRALHTGALALAIAALSLAAAAPPAHADGVKRGKVRSGNHAYKDGDYAKAFSLYREALGDSLRAPRDAQGVFYNGGNALYMQKQYGPAVDYYQRSYSPDSLLTGRMLYNRGNALLKAGRPQEAVESYVQSLQYLPDDEDARHNLEVALAAQQQQQQQKQQQKQNQDGKGDQNDSQDKQQGAPPDSSSQDQQQKQQQQQQGDEQQKQQQQPDPQPESAQPDSSRAQPQPADSTMAPLSEEQMRQLSPEDAMRILQALEDREEQLQKERRKAAFRKLKRSGKDW
ncbi:MAG TPA: VWA domain-containing protein [Candidatus Krumholzibacteria bacterium]|nr:VWA domain-containing protein [Candidatus Krumholzibacteria bacterium]